MTPEMDTYPRDVELDVVYLKDGREAYLCLNVTGKLVHDEIDAEPENVPITSVEDLEFWGRLYFEYGEIEDVKNASAFWNILERRSFKAVEDAAEEHILEINE